MRTIHLNTDHLMDKPSAHSYLSGQFGFPDYYGNNLDALWDMLTEISQDTTITLRGESSGYAKQIEALLQEATESNPNLHLTRHPHRLISGAQILSYEQSLPHGLYRRMLKSDYAISLWQDEEVLGWLMAQQASDRLIIESWQADTEVLEQELLTRMLADWPHQSEFLFLGQAPESLDNFHRSRHSITVYRKDLNDDD